MPVSEAYFEVGAMKAKYPPELQRTESKRRAKKSIDYERVAQRKVLSKKEWLSCGR